MKTSISSAIAIAVIAVSLMASIPFIDGSDAMGEDLSSEYGEASDISIAPGFEWRYTPTFPEDLTEFVSISLQVNDNSIGTVNGGTVVVSIPNNAVVGTVYNVVIKASMTSPVEQTAYQYVRFTVVNGLSVSGTINDIIAGTPVNFTPQGSSDMGTVTWTVKSGTQLPDGLELTDGKVIGTPTGIGEQTVSLTARCNGQESDLVVSFTVYSRIVGDSDETISSYGKAVSSRPITNPADIGVTWAVTSGELPEGFSLDPVTGVVSGQSTAVRSTTVTITGTSAHGPSQTTTKNITINSESELVLTGGNSILTYKGNGSAVTSSITPTTTSQITWSVSGYAGATVSDGTVSVINPATAGMGQKLTVTASTEYGQTKTIDIVLDVEDTLSITGTASMNAVAGESKASDAFTVNGGSGNVITASCGTVGPTVSIEDDRLVFNSASPLKDCQVTITVTSAAGQVSEMTVEVDVYNVLVFQSQPTGGAIIYPM